MNLPKVIIVEDETLYVKDIQRRLKNFNYDGSTTFYNGEAVLEYLETNTADIILMDIELKGSLDGIETSKKIRKKKDIPIIFLTGHTEEYLIERAKVIEPFGYILKPLEDRELHINISIALQIDKTKKELELSRQWNRTILNNLSDAIIVIDPDGRVNFVNTKAENLLDIKEDKILNKPLVDIITLLDEEKRAFTNSPFQKVLHKKKPFLANNVILKSNNGKEIHVDCNATPICDKNEDIKGVLITFKEP